MLATIFEVCFELALHLLVDVAGEHNTTGLAKCLQSSCDVDTVTVDVVPIDNHFTDVDPNPEQHALVFRYSSIQHGHTLLNANRAFNRTDRTAKFNEDAIARRAHNATAMCFNLRGPDFPPMRFHGRKSARLIGLYEPRIADHVGSKNSGQSPLCPLDHGASLVGAV